MTSSLSDFIAELGLGLHSEIEVFAACQLGEVFLSFDFLISPRGEELLLSAESGPLVIICPDNDPVSGSFFKVLNRDRILASLLVLYRDLAPPER